MAVIRTWRQRRTGVLPNETRVSCVAWPERSQMEFYPTRRATAASRAG